MHVKAKNNGILIKRKGINVPDTDFGGDIITAKDKKDIAYGSGADIDYVALSFIQNGWGHKDSKTHAKEPWLKCKSDCQDRN